MAYIDSDSLRDFHAPARSKTDEELDPVVRSAGRWVASLAPPPSEPDPGYVEAARDGELYVARHLLTGHLSSTSLGLSGLSKGESYSNSDEIRKVLRSVMGGYVKGSKLMVRSTRRG